MGIIIDVCVLMVLALTIFIGYKRGLVGVAFRIVSFLISILISLILFYPISNFIINNTQFDDKIEQTIVTKFVQEDKKEEKSNSLITKQIENMAEEVKENSVAIAAKNISRTIINFIVIVVLYVITRLVLLIFHAASDKIADLPIIKQFNEIGGIAYGIILGFLIIYIVFAVLALTSSLYNSEGLINTINSSVITKIIYNNNIILKIFF